MPKTWDEILESAKDLCPKTNTKAIKVRNNMPSVQLRLAKIHALNSLKESIRQLKKTGFKLTEILGLIHELFKQV